MSEPLKEKLQEPAQEHHPVQSILLEPRAVGRKNYVMLVLYMIFVSGYGYNVLYVQPIARSMKSAYNVQDSTLSFLLTLGSISSSIFFLPIIYLLVMKGVRVACMVGLGLLTFGTVVELFITEDRFWLIFVGHFITHSGSPVLNIANAKFSSTWFTPKVRPIAMTLIAMSSQIGLMMGFLIPGIFVSAPNAETSANLRSEVIHFHIFLLCLYGGSFILCIFFLEDYPKDYKTYLVEEMEIRKHFKMFQQLWALIQEPTYLYFVLTLGVGVASVVINQLIIVQMMTPFQYTQTNCQVGGVIIVLSGVTGSVGYSKLLIQFPNQLRKLKFIYMILLMVYTAYSYLPTFKSLLALYSACFLLGFFGMIQVAIGLESLVKYIILTGPQRLVIGTGFVQIILSISNGAFSYGIQGFLMEGTVQGVFKINLTIICTIFCTFILATLLQISFEHRITKIMKKADEPTLLPQVQPTVDQQKQQIMRSLAVDVDG